jgi:hypothetical protein
VVINVDWIPFIAIGVAVLAFALRLRGQPAGPRFGYRHANPVFGMVVGLGGMTVFALMSAVSAADLRVFRSDPACAAGFGYTGSVSSHCRVRYVSILDHGIAYHRHSTSYYLDLDLGNGAQRRVELYGYSPAFWEGIRSERDRGAQVQFYRNNIVAIETPDGVSETTSHPAVNIATYTLLGAVFGGIGLICALSIAFRGGGDTF